MIYNTTASAALPPPKSTGRPLKRLIATEERHAVADYIAALPDRSWRHLTWRMGTKGPLKGKFVAVRVRVGDGVMDSRGRHLPGDEVWLIAERRSSGEIKYYLSNLPAETSLLSLARVIKRRWVCEQAHHEAKDELGLDHFEERSWRGLHHHALLVMMALLFVQETRLKSANDVGDKLPSPTLPMVMRELARVFVRSVRRCSLCGAPSG